MEIATASIADGPAIKRLLTAAGLLTEDIADASLERFLVMRDGEQLVGAVGLDVADQDVLLRSLVVDESLRGGGHGKALVESAEALAKRRGARHIFLLTTTAAEFFQRRGYRVIPRDEAPPAIRATQQFSSLCPSTSTFMVKP
jgi:amino-acid N-acetyltransferase